MAKAFLSTERLLPALVATSIVLALLPARFSGWVGALSGPVEFALAPISDLASYVSRSFRPARPPDAAPDSELARLRADRDALQTQLLQAERAMGEMERLIRDLQGGIGMLGAGAMRSVSARVIGSGPDPADGTLIVRAGEDAGLLATDSFAVAGGVHLVGRVVGVGPRTSRVLPVTHRRAGKMQAIVLPGSTDDSLVATSAAGGFLCQLDPIGGGKLAGPLVAEAVNVEPGQVVRLSDPGWPEGAQMLVLGRVESVGPSPEQPLRQRVVVRPEIAPERVREVILRTPADADEAGAAP